MKPQPTPSRAERALQLFAALVTFLLFLAFAQADLAAVAWGDKGAQVTLIQQKLKQYGYFPVRWTEYLVRTPTMPSPIFSAKTD